MTSKQPDRSLLHRKLCTIAQEIVRSILLEELIVININRLAFGTHVALNVQFHLFLSFSFSLTRCFRKKEQVT
jgi:hypothetical protein